MYPRLTPIDRVFQFGPIIKSPATCHFRSLWLITEVDKHLTLVVGRQLIRPPWDSKTKRSDEVTPPGDWNVDYDDLHVAIASDHYDLEPLIKLWSEFVNNNGFRYGREMLVVAARVKSEAEPIGVVIDEKMTTYMDQQAFEYFTQYASDEMLAHRARKITGG